MGCSGSLHKSTALGVPARFYRPLVPQLLGHDFSVVLADCRPTAGRGDRTGYHQLAAADFPAVTAEIARRCPGQPIVLLGHSLGGQIGVSYAARHPGDLAGRTGAGFAGRAVRRRSR